MARIVFLNMADDLHVDGHKAVDALRIKYPPSGGGLFKRAKDQVVEVEMVPLYRAWKQNTHNPKDIAKVQKEVTAAKKVMISVHGPMKDVDYALIRDPMGGGDEQVTYQDLGRLLLALMAPGTYHNLTLVTCFAARSSSYGVDHQNLGAVNWTDSFAYKVFNEIVPAREVRMTARTGELGFNTASGVSEVQSELSIQGTIDNENIQAEAAVGQSQAWWNTNVARISASPTYGQFAVDLTQANNQATPGLKLQHLQALRGNHGLPPGQADTRSCLDYLNALIRLTEASSRQSDPIKAKYGKMVYRYLHGRGICVFAKYPNPVMVHPGPNAAVQASLLRKFHK